MKRQLGPIEKFKPLWEGGKSVEQYNIKVGFKIRMFCVAELNSLRQKNPNLFGQKETEELTKLILDLKQEQRNNISRRSNLHFRRLPNVPSRFFPKSRL
jgi:hypothetical protein